MQKLQDYWRERSSAQKLILVAAFLATFGVVAGVAALAGRPSMALLYGGLDSAAAGEVAAGIDKSGVAYEVRGDQIWVDASARDRLRIDLAAQGLPAAGAAGYELLDGMSGFGTTSQMFDAAYWRAKEGELARTILAIPNVRTARVHLAVEAARGYRREAGGTASVTLTTQGGPVTPEQAAALKYLVSSGVPGMKAEAVTVIDSARGIVATGEETTGRDRAEAMKRNVERILEPHVGAGNAVVELNLDLVTETEALTEERYDPQERALISQVTEETSDESDSAGSGAVTAASNLPDGDDEAGPRASSARTENRQQANFEVSTVRREVSRRPGDTRRLTVAVLVNGIPTPAEGGETSIIPRTEAELEVLRELVASAVGFDAERGDLITVKSLPFSALAEAGTSATPSLLDRLNLDSLVRLAIIAVFALAALLMLMRTAMRARGGASPAGTGAPSALEGPDAILPLLPDPAMTGTVEPYRGPLTFDGPLMGGPDDTLALPSADPVARLRSMMRERQDESVKILSGWIDRKERA